LNEPLVILSATGLGKSALVSSWLKDYNASKAIIHFVGLNSHSKSFFSLKSNLLTYLLT